MDGWELALVAIAGYVAAMTLVRLMRRRRDALIRQLRMQLEAEQQRKRDEARRRREAELFGEVN